tara:strand:+ start:159 stop:1880 length:1722 start_codon:yes stop_codon:yes gene_type:complete
MAQYQDPVEEQDLLQETVLPPITVENVLDKIAIAIINSPLVDSKLLKENQKTIRNGLITIGRSNSENLLLYEKDSKANADDLTLNMLDGNNQVTLNDIINSFEGDHIGLVDIQVLLTGDNHLDAILMTDLVGNYTWDVAPLLSKSEISEDGFETILNPLNISQFINLEEVKEKIKPSLADEHLNRKIYELLPEKDSRQEQIDKFFIDFNALIGQTPNFEIQDGLVSEYFLVSGSNEYAENHDISLAQDTPDIGIDEDSSYITRLDKDSNTKNSGKTLQSMRDTLNEYLKDIDQDPLPPEDLRPEYENKSEGYLQFRDLNQGIIVRNINDDAISGLNPTTQDYLNTGLTITMWVRFKDQVSSGTLFNFGNPTRAENPFGFKLETFVINKNALYGDTFPNSSNAANTWNELLVERTGDGWNYGTDILNENFFNNSDNERFIRLVVRENESTIRSSHMGKTYVGQRNPGCPEWGNYGNPPPSDQGYVAQSHIILHPRVAYNPEEWYFICATYDNRIDEDGSYTHNNFDAYKNDFDFWMGNKSPDSSQLTNFSGYGARCKVEMISRTDLLRARGFKV